LRTDNVFGIGPFVNRNHLIPDPKSPDFVADFGDRATRFVAKGTLREKTVQILVQIRSADTAVFITLIFASPGPGVGSATSSTRRPRMPWYIAALKNRLPFLHPGSKKTTAMG
jgi:hypothetical protein